MDPIVADPHTALLLAERIADAAHSFADNAAGREKLVAVIIEELRACRPPVEPAPVAAGVLLDGLRREHTDHCRSHYSTWDDVVLPCSCGADAHNTRVEELRALLAPAADAPEPNAVRVAAQEFWGFDAVKAEVAEFFERHGSLPVLAAFAYAVEGRDRALRDEIFAAIDRLRAALGAK